MQIVPKWRSFLILRNSLTQSATPYVALFHSTAPSFEKWKSKWNSPDARAQQPSKTYIKYVTRRKRADTRRALGNLLFGSGSSKLSFQDDSTRWDVDGKSGWSSEHADCSDCSGRKGRSKSSARRGGKLNKRSNCKDRRESLFDNFEEHPETIFEATFGNRRYTWSFMSRNDSSFHSSTTGFEWREHCSRSNNKKWDAESEGDDSEDESCVVGSFSDRKILGLPPSGTLKIEDVKIAFRLSALKWHPDKHQGPSQAMAEERFKLCVNAYKSLCSALSPV